MHPRKLIRDSVHFAFSLSVVRIALMARGLLAARMLGPLGYGAWNAMQLMMDYGVFAAAGTQQGLDQAVPAKIVAGDASALARLKRAGFANIMLTTLIFIAGCLICRRRAAADFSGCGASRASSWRSAVCSR